MKIRIRVGEGSDFIPPWAALSLGAFRNCLSGVELIHSGTPPLIPIPAPVITAGVRRDCITVALASPALIH